MAFLLLRRNMPIEAGYELDKILQNDRNHVFANRDKGRILVSQRKPLEAVPHLQRALTGFLAKVPPDQQSLAEIHQLLAVCYNALRDPERAKFHTEEYKRRSGKSDKDG